MFEITEEDLKANNRGQLGPGQREWLKMIGKGRVRLQGFNVWFHKRFESDGSGVGRSMIIARRTL